MFIFQQRYLEQNYIAKVEGKVKAYAYTQTNSLLIILNGISP